MSKTREKFLAISLLTLIIGVLHFFFGRVILSAVLSIIEIALFWIIGAAIVIGFLCVVIAAICDVDTIKKAEKWIEVQLNDYDEECDDCDCDDEDCEYHVAIHCKNKKKECCCASEDDDCECEVNDNDESEVVEEVEVESEEDELPDPETKDE